MVELALVVEVSLVTSSRKCGSNNSSGSIGSSSNNGLVVVLIFIRRPVRANMLALLILLNVCLI